MKIDCEQFNKMNVYIIIFERKTKDNSDQCIIGVYKNENDAQYQMKTNYQKEKEFFEKYEQLKDVHVGLSQCEFTTKDTIYKYYINTQRVK